jgi:hypothetical protein
MAAAASSPKVPISTITPQVMSPSGYRVSSNLLRTEKLTNESDFQSWSELFINMMRVDGLDMYFEQSGDSKTDEIDEKNKMYARGVLFASLSPKLHERSNV